MLRLLPGGPAAAALVIVFALFFLAPLHAFAAQPCSRPLVLWLSWYGAGNLPRGVARGHGKGFCQTASGIPFDGSQLLVANKALPFGTRVRFTYQGRSIVLPVEDRGPWIKGRVFDLSRAAAQQLGMAGRTAGVRGTCCAEGVRRECPFKTSSFG